MIFSEFFEVKKKMCERCAQVDPKKRPSISELIDSFYKDYYCDIHIHLFAAIIGSECN